MPVCSIRYFTIHYRCNLSPIFIKHKIVLNGIILFELSISAMIAQSPSLVSIYDTLVLNIKENDFLNVIGSQYLVANKAIKWSTIKFLGCCLLTHQRFY